MKATGLANVNLNANVTWTKTMTNSSSDSNSYVVCIDNTGYMAALEKHKIYRAIHDDTAAVDGDVRIVDESGEDYLYPAERFVTIAVPAEVEKSLTAVG